MPALLASLNARRSAPSTCQKEPRCPGCRKPLLLHELCVGFEVRMSHAFAGSSPEDFYGFLVFFLALAALMDLSPPAFFPPTTVEWMELEGVPFSTLSCVDNLHAKTNAPREKVLNRRASDSVSQAFSYRAQRAIDQHETAIVAAVVRHIRLFSAGQESLRAARNA